MPKPIDLLPQASFSILLALSLKPRHGYEIMKQVKEDSLDKIKLGPGALYAAIKQLNDAGLITEVPGKVSARRRYYRLTRLGHSRLNAQIAYLDNSLKLARERQVYSLRLGDRHA